jgi:glucarate dehydratase
MREAVDYYYYMEWGTPQEIERQGRDGVKRGYRAYYIKAGVDEKKEEAMLEALRHSIGPEDKIRIDVNQAWTGPQAVRLLNRWHERFDLDFVEAPFCINEGLWREADAYRLIKSRCGDYLCYSQYWVGSVMRWHALNWTAHLEGWQVIKHTHGELGLTAAAGQHVMLAAPNAAIGSQQTANRAIDGRRHPRRANPHRR